MKRTLLYDCAVLSVAGALATAIATVAMAGGSAEAERSASASGQKACIDPATGKLVSPEERPECRVAPDEAAAPDDGERQTSEGLEEEAMDDGSKVDLEGRFQQNRATTPPTRDGGRIAIIDPRTGELVTGEAPARLREREDLERLFQEFDASLEEAVSEAQSVEGLEEQRLTTGAVKVDLEGRFRSPLVATVSPDGGVVLRHGSRSDRVRDAD